MNRMRVMFILFFIFLFTGAGFLSAKLPAKLSVTDRDKIFKCLLKSPYPYMFQPKLPPTKGQHPNSLTKYVGRTHGILWYASLSDCIGGKSKKWADLKPMEKALGFKLTKPSTNWLKVAYRSEIIQWGTKNLIPLPNETLYGVPYQKMYDSTMFYFIRRMATAYKYLTGEPDLMALETARYRNMMGKDFWDKFADYDKHLRKKNPLLQVSEWAFWIRRHADGTRPALWQALQKVLILYDEDWYNKNELAALAE